MLLEAPVRHRVPRTAQAPTAPRACVRSGVGRVEDDLLRRFVTRGDLAAREELVARLQPIIHRLARRYRHSGYLEDLEQAAALGLTKALERFDPDHGTDLVRYAVPTMVGEMRRWLRDHSWAVRPPREAAETWLEVVAATEHLGAELGHAPTPAELAAHLHLPLDRVAAALDARRGRFAVSLDAPLHSDAEDRTVADQLGMEDDELRHAFERTWLDELGAGLEPLERDVVRLSFTGDLSQREIAALLDLSQMKVCRVLRRAVDRLRDADLAAEATATAVA
ncbi:MAG: polymerase sigma-B factor [Solirubrobacteraceae bacterium]|jgi:RNA polymerase sigma-B factor|nr:polymerase sigma-B factor [Solirubrobacteraceae bacterium]MEA2278269.1 polymerase sigma-B factor [Solirubrobacteraceae bacterium]